MGKFKRKVRYSSLHNPEVALYEYWELVTSHQTFLIHENLKSGGTYSVYMSTHTSTENFELLRAGFRDLVSAKNFIWDYLDTYPL